jgi:hypothetical protein
MPDSWLKRGARRGRPTSAKQARQLTALRVPKDVCQTLQRWAASPVALEPLLRLIRNIFFSNAVHQARMTQARWLAGRARDPHYTGTPEAPGALQPLRKLVDQVVADLERLINWQFTPPLVLHELDAKLKPTGRIVRLARLDKGVRDGFERARSAVLGLQAALHEVTDRHRGRKVTLVQPFPVSTLTTRAARPTPARRRELVRRIGDELLRLHPKRTTHPRTARLAAGRLARCIGNSILPPQFKTPPRAGE